MSLTAKTSEFKARLAHYLRVVRRGGELVVMDRETAIARGVPYEARQQPLIGVPRDPKAPRIGDVAVRGVRARDFDSAAALRADRDRR